jgi:hypothetical protein
MSRFAFRVRLFVLRRIWRARLRPWSNGGGGGQAEGDVQGGGGPLLRPRSGPMQPCVQALGDFVRGELRGAV